MNNVRLGTLAAAIVLLAGCSTHLGYVPHDVYAGRWSTPTNAYPSYDDVKTWARKVADGYDSRATANRQMIYGGAFVAAAAAGALTGLAAFAPGSSAIIGIPIGTTFLSGAMTIYNNEQKAVIYGLASENIRSLMIQSDCRNTGDTSRSICSDAGAMKCTVPLPAHEPECLHREVANVMERVEDHITNLDPKNVQDKLKAIAASVEARRAFAAQKQKEADEAAKLADLDKEKEKATNAAENAEKAQDAADQAQADAKKAQDEAAARMVATAANDYDELKIVTADPLCTMPPRCASGVIDLGSRNASPAPTGP
jgi:hypothetical protein